MSAIKSQHSRLFESLIAEHRQGLLESIALGHDKHTYWRLVGQIEGINDALKFSEHADFKISGAEPE